MVDAAARFARLSEVPRDDERFEEWLRATAVLEFLEANASADYIVIDASSVHAVVHGVLIPAGKVDLIDVDDLLPWNCDASSIWDVSCTMGDPAEVSLCPPLDMTGSKTLDHGEQLVFSRFFERRRGRKSYRELSQRLVQVLDLHFIVERNAYCRVDRLGEIDDVTRTAGPRTSLAERWSRSLAKRSTGTCCSPRP